MTLISAGTALGGSLAAALGGGTLGAIGSGAILNGLLGAGLGAGVGALTGGDPGEGALIGGLGGALGGGFGGLGGAGGKAASMVSRATPALGWPGAATAGVSKAAPSALQTFGVNLARNAPRIVGTVGGLFDAPQPAMQAPIMPIATPRQKYQPFMPQPRRRI